MYNSISFLSIAAITLLNPCFTKTMVLTGPARHFQITDSLKFKSEPVMFAPGIIPTTASQTAAPAFAPDSKSVYFGQHKDGKDITIFMSQKKGNTWSVPALASFSGNFLNLEPAFAPSGKYLIFASSRSKTVGGPILDGHYNGQVFAGKGGNLWKVPFTKKGWGQPELLPEIINSNTSIFSPAVAGDGSLYFMQPDTAGIFHIFRSQLNNGHYETPVRASFCLDKFGDYDPAVAPNESFLIYSTARPPAIPHRSDLFIVFRTPTGWSEPLDLRTVISENVFGVEARLSPDLKTLYFSNSRNAKGEIMEKEQYTWQVDISGLLKAHGLK